MCRMFLITFLHIISVACFAILLYEAIQPGEALGIWHRLVLDKIYNEHPLLEKFLGGCMKCFTHLISILAYPVFMVIQWKMDLWIGWWNIPVYFFVVPVTIILAQFIYKHLTK